MQGGRGDVEEMIQQAKAPAENMDVLGPERDTRESAVEEAGWQVVEQRSPYAATVQHTIPYQHTTIMAWQGTRDCQVLIDFTSPADQESSREMSEAELVTKANLAITLLRDETGELPSEFTFTLVRKLWHGGCLYKVNSVEATQWLK